MGRRLVAAKIFTISGVSGSGKTTIIQAQLDRLGCLCELVTSTTTRKQRNTDIKGEYEYISFEEFENLKQKGKFLETVEFGPNRYGTKNEYLDQYFYQIKKVGLMIVTPDVIPIIKKYIFERCGLKYGPYAVYSFYILAPPKKILRERLKKRGETQKNIKWMLQESNVWDKKAQESGAFNEFLKNEESKLTYASLHVMQRIIDLST